MISRKTSFIVIVVLLSLIGGGLMGFYFYVNKKNPEPTFLGQTTGGTRIGYDLGGNKPSTSTDTFIGDPIATSTLPVPKLRQITDEPIAGADFLTIDVFATTTGTSTQRRVIGTRDVIRYMERGSGHIFETSTSSLEIGRISNTTYTKVYEALFVDKSGSVVIRDLIGGTDVIQTQFGSMQLATTTSDEMELVFKQLPVNLLQVALSPSRNQIFSIQSGGERGILTRPDGSSKSTIFNNPFKEWLVQWPNTQGISLTTKASGFFPGYSYILNPQTRDFSRVLGGINGLTTLVSPDLSRVLYSESGSGSIKLFVLNRRTGEIRDLYTRTLPEKCVWSKKESNSVYCAVPSDIAFNNYPDVWYQGIITFSDDIWKINVDTGETRIVSEPQKDVGKIIDVINPVITSKDDYLMFSNKIDLSLWGLQLVEPPAPVNTDPIKTLTSTSSASTTR